VVQDWGGPIGLAVLAADQSRFARVVASNTILHTSDPALEGRLGWANHGVGDGRVVLQEALVDYIAFTQRAPVLRASDFVSFATVGEVPPEVLAAYDAPFPDEIYKEGARQFPLLVPTRPDDPASGANRRAWETLKTFDKPFLCAFSDADPITKGADALFLSEVPGTRGQEHPTIGGAGHFLQEDSGPALAEAVATFVRANPAG
jgi:haloalkane dehalogenase